MIRITDKYLFLLDTSTKVNEGDYVICDETACRVFSSNDWRIPCGLVIYREHKNSFIKLAESDKKVIAYYPLKNDSVSLNLELLPPFIDSSIDSYIKGLKEYPYRDINNDLALGGFMRGYSMANKDRKFTLEEMENAFYIGWIDRGENKTYPNAKADFIKSITDDYYPKDFVLGNGENLKEQIFTGKYIF